MTPLQQAKERLGILQIGAKLYPGWKPGKSCRSPWREDRRPSFSVSEDGRLWNCFASGEGGDAVDFLAKAQGLSNADACRELIQMAGIQRGEPSSVQRGSTPPAKQAPRAKQEVWTPEAIPDDVAAVFIEGCKALATSPNQRDKIAKWRGWPESFVELLAREAMLSTPLWNGRRVLAWSVACPEAGNCFQLLDVGIHIRVPAREGREHPAWMFAPNEKTHPGKRVPACPVLWGDFPSSRVLIFTEGQWDAASIGLAAGWFEPSIGWPDRVAVVGIRGAQGLRPFFDHYERFWPDAARAVLVCDADAAGATWFTAKDGKSSFAQRLAERCSRVQVLRPSGGAKDFNDMLKAGDVSPDAMRSIFNKLQLSEYL